MENLNLFIPVDFYRQHDIRLLFGNVLLPRRFQEREDRPWAGRGRNLCLGHHLPVNYLLEITYSKPERFRGWATRSRRSTSVF